MIHEQATSIPNKIPDNFLDTLMQGFSLGDCIGFKEADQESIYTVGYQLYQSGKIQDAAKVFRFLGLMDPLNRKSLFALAACEKALGNYRAAIDLFSVAALLDIQDQQAFFEIGVYYMSLEEFDHAHSAFSTVAFFAGKPGGQTALKQRAKKMLEVCEMN